MALTTLHPPQHQGLRLFCSPTSRPHIYYVPSYEHMHRWQIAAVHLALRTQSHWLDLWLRGIWASHCSVSRARILTEGRIGWPTTCDCFPLVLSPKYWHRDGIKQTLIKWAAKEINESRPQGSSSCSEDSYDSRWRSCPICSFPSISQKWDLLLITQINFSLRRHMYKSKSGLWISYWWPHRILWEHFPNMSGNGTFLSFVRGHLLLRSVYGRWFSS